MLARSAFTRFSRAAMTAPCAVALRPRPFSVVVFDESSGSLRDIVEKPDAKVIAYFTAS